jgi:hypothetical protein
MFLNVLCLTEHFDWMFHCVPLRDSKWHLSTLQTQPSLRNSTQHNDFSGTCSFAVTSDVSFLGAAAEGTFSLSGHNVRTAAFLPFTAAAAAAAVFGEQLSHKDSQRASLKDNMMRWVLMF